MKKTETEILYEDALASAEAIYNLALETAKEGIMEELEPKIKRFVSKKLQSEIEGNDEELDDEELDNILDIEESEEAEEVELDSELGDEPDNDFGDDPDSELGDELDLDISDISDEIDLDLSDILGDESDEELGFEVEDDEVEESIQIEETDDESDEELIDLEALVKEIADEEDEELGFEVEDDEVEDDEVEDDKVEEGKTVERAGMKKKLESALAENTKLKTGISILKEKVDEYVLVNNKLKLISKTFASNNFSKKEKIKVIESFDKATTVKESIKVFDTIKNIVNKSKKRRVSEGAGSKVIGTTRPPAEKKVIVEQDNGIFKK